MKTTRGDGWNYYCHKCGTNTDGMRLTRKDVDEFAGQHKRECAGKFPNDLGPVKPSSRHLNMWPQMLSHR